MLALISVLLVGLTCVLAIPVAVFFFEVAASLILRPPREALADCGGFHRRVAVLVPAHNEGRGLLPTLADINSQLRTFDRLLVVADNCTDDTAAVASAAGATVIDRNDPERRGKGYALAWGVRYLDADPPDIVVIIDADCRLAEGAIDRLVSICAATGRPVQSLYLMRAPDESLISLKVAEFAWRVRNWVRPLGLAVLHLPCQLMGTGMAFPWAVLRSANLANGSIVEDLKLGLDLAAEGHSPVFSPVLSVSSNFASSAQGIQSQRMRWEQGHLGIIFAEVPRLACDAIRSANFPLLMLLLDVSVPPLSLLALLLTGALVIDCLAALFGLSVSALSIGAAALAGYAAAIFLCWFKYGRDILPLGAIPQIWSYVIDKIPVYKDIASRRSNSQWIRTDRRKL